MSAGFQRGASFGGLKYNSPAATAGFFFVGASPGSSCACISIRMWGLDAPSPKGQTPWANTVPGHTPLRECLFWYVLNHLPRGFFASVTLQQSYEKYKAKTKHIFFSPPLYSPHWHTNQWCLITDVSVFFSTQKAPNLLWFDLGFFNFMMVQKGYVFNKRHTLNFKFWSFPRPAICCMILSHDAGQHQQPEAPSWPHDHGGNNRYPTAHCVVSGSAQLWADECSEQV